MLASVSIIRRWHHIAFVLALIAGLALLSGQASAEVTGRESVVTSGLGHDSGSTTRDSALFDDKAAPNAPLADAFLFLAPGTGGSVPAPANGGTVPVGGRFVLDLMIDSGTTDTAGQQSYLTFTSSILQNARVSDINSACTLTGTVTEDLSTFDTVIQNEVCNGPGNCIFRGVTVAPGSLAFASIGVANCGNGCVGTFRVARIGLCAVAPGQAMLHWQFSPPAPISRDTEIIDHNNNLVHNPALFTDYVINVVTPTSTPTPTPGGAFMFLTPGTGGSVPAPPNGGTVPVGSRFVLDLMLNSGSHNDLAAQQSYLTFTSSILQNARVSDINSACTLTSTVTADSQSFEDTFQNEVCNGPGNCVFRGVTVGPGSIGFISGDLTGNTCPMGCRGVFRLARIGLCAVAPGQAVLHWQFSPPAPATRDTEIVDINNNLVHDPALFTDYVINVLAPTSTPTATSTPSTGDAFLFLTPGTGGSVPAPENGGTVPVGGRFVLDLILDTGSHPNVTAQQSYLTFSSSILQNARVSDINSGCTLTSTVSMDSQVFENPLQNEVCNGPGNCIFRGISVGPGSMAYASGGLINCPSGCGGTFRVAQIGLCATGPGQAVLHWQFHPPDPITRDTEIVDRNSNIVSDPALFTDYVINVVGAPTSTPTNTPTPERVMRGHVTWEGRPAQPHPLQQLPISLTLRLASGGPYFDYPYQDTDASGYFTVPVTGLPEGTYTWRVKDPQYLANSGTLTLSSAPVTQVEMGLMRTGDANSDNVVNTIDFIILKSSFGRACGNPGYEPMADFTGDCVVNATDFTLLKANFGHAGASPTGP